MSPASPLGDAPLDLPRPVPRAVDGIRVGVGGWTFAPWRDNFYPAGLVQRRELEFASRQLTAIEVNGTYYRAQKPAVYAKWRDETPEGFVFSAKAPLRIVSARVLGRTGKQVEDFLGDIAELGDRLGPILWQFDAGPPIDRADFAAFVALLPQQVDGWPLRHVLDVRDPASCGAWLLSLARKHGCATVFTDSAEHPSFSDVTGEFVYARLMRARGEIATGYTPAELRQWAARARLWAAGGEPDDLPRIEGEATQGGKPRDVFVFFINADKARNPAAAVALIEALALEK